MRWGGARSCDVNRYLFALPPQKYTHAFSENSTTDAMAHFDFRSATKRDRASDLLALPLAAPVDDMALCAAAQLTREATRGGQRQQQRARQTQTRDSPTARNRAIRTRGDRVRVAEQAATIPSSLGNARVEEQI